jgi:hypothetical protein
MAWKYPPYPIRNDQVLGIDALNENFLGYTEELSGTLNEHNFSTKAGPLFDRTDLAKDVAHILHRSRPIDPMPHVNDYRDRDGWLTIRQMDGWQTFTGATGGNTRGMGMSINAQGGTCWICGSLNLHVGDIYDSVTSAANQLGFGFNFAIQIDGNIVFESLLGSADSTNEFYNGHNGRAFHTSVTGTPARYNTPQCGGGVTATQLPVVVDAVIELAPGPHEIRIAVMNIRGQNKSGASENSGWGTKSYISARELFMLELVR